ncbi:MAG: IS3 family transposase [Anaerolineae bacterium]|nr:IS3 family transposase [Anaerolineae bacterium]
MSVILNEREQRKWQQRTDNMMPQQHLVAKHRRRRVRTTDSHHRLPVVANHLNRDFTAKRPNEKWVADITYIDTLEGWLYLALVLDVFSRKVVGWAMEAHPETRLVEAALRMALLQRKPALGELLDHSDRGGQYASATYQALLASFDITVSMSHTADLYDNALMESCIGTLKTECAEHVFPCCQPRARASRASRRRVVGCSVVAIPTKIRRTPLLARRTSVVYPSEFGRVLPGLCALTTPLSVCLNGHRHANRPHSDPRLAPQHPQDRRGRAQGLDAQRPAQRPQADGAVTQHLARRARAPGAVAIHQK